MATLQGKAVKNTYRQVLQIGANNVGVSGTLQPVQDGAGNNTALSLSTLAATVNGDLTITGDLIITGGGIQIQDLIDDTVATLIQNGTGITWAYNDTARTLTPTITIATADGGVQGDYLQLNTNANEASAVGKLKWNTTDGTLDIGLMGGQVVLQVGQEQVARVLNNSGSILTEAGYQAVKISSAQGQRLAVTLAQANNEANSTDTLGLVTENIANNKEGFVTTSGLVRQIDTTGDLQSEVWVDGDTLYLSPTVPGGVTKVKPLAPQQTVIVGFVVYAHKTQGKIFVKVDNGYEISELHDVRITSVANNNILKYNSSLSVWENVAGTTTNIAEGTNLYYTQARFDSAFAAKTTTNLAEGTNLYFTTARGDANFATNFATKTTTNLPEGTNLYFTNARSRGALSVTAGTGISYNSSTGNFELSAIPNASLANDEVTINGSAVALGASLTLTTSDIAEGTNLYWTNARFDSRFSTKTTTDLAEGTNLYYTQARFNTAFSAKSTTDLAEGTNLYYTDARARAAFSENAVGLDYSAGSGVLSLTSGYAIPTTVKLGQYDTAYNRSIVSAAVTGTGTKTLTLTEQDANTITATWTDQGITTINGTANQIAANTVGNTTTVGFTNDVTFPNNVVVSGNLTINGTATYVNTQSISSKDPLFEVANDNNTTDAVDIGYYGRYYDSAQTRVEFTGLFRDASDAGKYKIFSGLVDEPTNVVDTTGTGYTVGTLVANVEGNLAGTANAANVLSTARSISATGDAAWTVSFDGSANATGALTLANTGVTATTYGTTTAVPTIAIDGKGRITSASNTAIAFPVTTVNSLSGNVVLTTTNIAEGTNQYFTTGRAQSAISLTTTGTSGAATYSGGVFNIPTYIGGSGTANEIAFFSTTGVISSLSTGTYPSLTELSYVKGVTSSIQTQFSAKANDNAVVHLSGTETITGTKTFSENITITNSARPYLITKTTSATEEAGIKIQQTTVSDWYLGVAQGTPSVNDFAIRDVKNSRIPFYISASNGASTFSSSVTASSFVQGGYLIGSGTRGLLVLTSADWGASTEVCSNISISGATGGDYFGFKNPAGKGYTFTVNGTSIASISSTGAATFSTSVTSGGYLANGSITIGMPIDTGGTKAYFDASAINGPALTLRADGVGRTIRMTSDGTGTVVGAIDANSSGLNIGTNTSHPIIFNPQATERFKIMPSGNTGVGKTGSITGLDVYFASTDCINARTGAAAGPSISLFTGWNSATATTSGTLAFNVVSNGNVYNTNNSYGSLSDIKLKENIIDATPKLDDLLKVKIRNYNLKGQETKQIGVIAQELEEVFPSMVEESEDFEELDVTNEDGTITKERQLVGTTTKSVKYSIFVPILIKAIQELEARVKELEAK